MNSRERIIKTVKGEKTDRAPFIFMFGPWHETLDEWHKQGLPPDRDWLHGVGADDGFKAIPFEYLSVGYCPAFKHEIIKEEGNKTILRDSFGILQEFIKGHSAIPNFLEYPVKTPDDWKRLKEERLSLNFDNRLQTDWDTIKKFAASHDGITQLGDYPYGLFGTARDLLGAEELLMWFYDYPEVVKDIMDTLTDLWISIYKEAAKHIRIDCIHMWEDMSGKCGPLISPAMVNEFMVPNYKKIKQFCVEYDVPIFSLDTDGDCELLIEPFIEAGINLIFPFEVTAGSDIVEIKKKYPTEFCALGGIDKRELAKGKYEIDKELERIAPALEIGGYIPQLDHHLPPDISYENCLYYIKRLKELIFNGV